MFTASLRDRGRAVQNSWPRAFSSHGRLRPASCPPASRFPWPLSRAPATKFVRINGPGVDPATSPTHSTRSRPSARSSAPPTPTPSPPCCAGCRVDRRRRPASGPSRGVPEIDEGNQHVAPIRDTLRAYRTVLGGHPCWHVLFVVPTADRAAWLRRAARGAAEGSAWSRPAMSRAGAALMPASPPCPCGSRAARAGQPRGRAVTGCRAASRIAAPAGGLGFGWRGGDDLRRSPV